MKWLYSFLIMVALTFSFSVSAVSNLGALGYGTPAFTVQDSVGLPTKVSATDNTEQVDLAYNLKLKRPGNYGSYLLPQPTSCRQAANSKPIRGYTRVLFS